MDFSSLRQPPLTLTLFLPTNILMQILKHSERLNELGSEHFTTTIYNEHFAVFVLVHVHLSIPPLIHFIFINFKISCNISTLYPNYFSMHNFYLEFNIVLWFFLRSNFIHYLPLLWTFVSFCVDTYRFSFLLSLYLEVEFLGHIVTPCLTFWGTRKLFSRASCTILYSHQYMRVSISPIFINTYYYLLFWFRPS